MSNVKIVVEEKLGGQVSFGGKEIRVLKSTYEAVPEDKRAEFDEVLIRAQEKYQSKVADAKARGEKPQASKLKAEAIAEEVTPFMEANSVSKGTVKRAETRVIKPTIPRDNLKRETTADTSKEALQKEFDNFPADILDDSSDETKKPDEVKGDFDDLADELGLDDVLFDGDEDMPGTAPSSDPFDSPDGDFFDDIDLDI